MVRPPKKKRTPADIPFKEVKNHLLASLRNINLPATRHSVMCVLLMWWTLIENNDTEREKQLWTFIDNHFMNKRGQIQWREEDDPKKVDTEGERSPASLEAADNIRNAWNSIPRRTEDASNI